MKIHKDFTLSDVLWYKIGGTAKQFIIAENKEDILRALDFVDKNHISRLFICGLGSNLIFSDDYFDGAVIQITSGQNNVVVDKDGLMTAFAGAKLDDVIKDSFTNNLTGLEWAGGLPGTVGAAVRGNVGAFGGEIKDRLNKAEVLEINGAQFNLHTFSKPDLNFSYRNSFIKEHKNYVVISASFQLKESSKEEIEEARKIYFKNIDYRKINHPLDYPNCGSVFKNISKQDEVKKVLEVWPDIRELVEIKWHGKVSMGYIIKRLEFSEHRVGNVQVSPKHANFIVNLGGGRARDVLAIISDIQDKVSETFGFIPEVEVEVVS